MRRIIVGLMVASVLPLGASALSFSELFGRKQDPQAPATESNATRRYHLLLTDKDSEKELVQLMTAKRIVAEELRVLVALTAEKKQELANFNARLKEQFEVSPEGNYHYDFKSKTIFTQTLKPGVTNVTAAADPLEVFERKSHKALSTDEEARQFVGLATGKQQTQEELGVFVRVMREKQLEMERVDVDLKDKFSMSRDRNYWYDAASMRLYEIVAPARKGSIKQDKP